MAKRTKPSQYFSAARSGGGAALLVFALLFVAAWIVYGRALDAPFIFDDLLSVEDNPSIVQLWPLVGDAEHRGPLRPLPETPTSARPLVNLSFAVNYQFGRLDPWGYRVVNLALHVLNATLLWAIVRRTLLLPYFSGTFDRAAGPIALIVALLWMLHPLATETVVYITQRSELMVAIFYLATIYASLRYWTAAAPRSRTFWLILAVVASIAGAASKEVMVSAPLVVLLFERTFLRDSFRQALQQSWPLYAGLAMSWILLAVLQLDMPRSASAGFGLGTPLADWWSTQARVFLLYLKLALYPAPLLIHYESSLQSLAANWIYVAAVIALAVGTLLLLWRRHPAGFLAACVFAILAPTCIIPIPTEMAAERRMYLPLAALVALVVVGCYSLVVRIANRSASGSDPQASRFRKVATGAVVLALLMVCGVASARRADEFNHPVILWQQVVVRQPNSHVAHHGIAVRLFEEGRLGQAIEHYREAVRLHPEYPEAQYGLGLALVHVGQYDAAVEHLRKVVQLKPQAVRIRNNLGVALFSAGRFDEAIAEFQEALKLDPQMWETHDNLGRALQKAGRADEAKQHFDEAARLNREFGNSADSTPPTP